jgi:hypothetical protein
MKSATPNRRRAAAFCGAFLLSAAFWVSSCDGTREHAPEPGSETNFLRRCVDNASCGGGLSCLCGTCTRTCGGPGACDSLSSGAACVPVASRTVDPSCPGSAVSAFCDALCADDMGCAALGDSYRCDRGYCRAVNPNCRTGATLGSEVVILGDTFLSNTHEITQALEDLARSSGALSTEESYRDYSSGLQSHLAAEPPGLSSQLETALEEGPVEVVIMDGGGSDVLMNRCPDPIAADCPLIVDAAAGASLLFQSMAAAGIEHVVFFSYPDYVGDARIKATIDTLRPLLEDRCENAPIPCHWLDLRPTFAGNYDEYVLPDGRNPTTAGSRASAEALWGLMQQRCVAQ